MSLFLDLGEPEPEDHLLLEADLDRGLAILKESRTWVDFLCKRSDNGHSTVRQDPTYSIRSQSFEYFILIVYQRLLRGARGTCVIFEIYSKLP
jgi:hypothetical protein